MIELSANGRVQKKSRGEWRYLKEWAAGGLFFRLPAIYIVGIIVVVWSMCTRYRVQTGMLM